MGWQDALATILPGPADTSFLRACLLDRDAAEAAWRSWRECVGNPQAALETDERGMKGLLPLLCDAVIRHRLEASAALQTYLKASQLREQLRWNAIEAILRDIFAAAGQRGIELALLGGAASALVDYSRPEHRHTHGVRLWAGEAAEEARGLFSESTWRATHSGRFGPVAETFQHKDGLPVWIHTDIVDHPCHGLGHACLLHGPIRSSETSSSLVVVSATENLIAILAFASTSPLRDNLRWACDAWLLIRRVEAIDWSLFRREVERRRLGLIGAVLCTYLKNALDAAIPDAVIASLQDLARRSSASERDAALVGALQGFSSTRRFISRGNVKTRAAAIRFLIFPSRNVMDWAHGPDPSGRRLLRYVERPAAHIGSRIRRRFFET